MTAILIASTFLCTLCTFVQSYWNQGVQQDIHASGDWDAQLLEVQAGQLPLIQDNDKVQAVMVVIHYNCIGAFEVPDRRKIPERDILLETRKGVALSYAPTQIAI